MHTAGLLKRFPVPSLCIQTTTNTPPPPPLNTQNIKVVKNKQKKPRATNTEAKSETF